MPPEQPTRRKRGSGGAKPAVYPLPLPGPDFERLRGALDEPPRDLPRLRSCSANRAGSGMPEFLAQPPRPLQPGDPVAAFDCGVEELNRYLQRFAWANQQANAAMTYVAMRRGAIAGYYTVVAAPRQRAGRKSVRTPNV